MTENTLEEMVDHSDKEFTDYIARKTLKELLKVCEAHNLSKEGLMEEMEQGLDPQEDTGKVTTRGNQEVIDLDLEEIALRGEKRINLNLDQEHSEIPRKVVEHDLQNP